MCDDFGHGQRDGEVQDVSDNEAWDHETRKRRLSAVEVAKHDVSHFCIRGRGRGRQHKAATNTERTRPLLSEDCSSSAENEPRTKHQCW